MYKLLVLCVLTATSAGAEPFKREDWVYVNDVAAPDKFGINHWGLESFPLGFRAAQRGKHAAESRYADNFRFQDEVGVFSPNRRNPAFH